VANGNEPTLSGELTAVLSSGEFARSAQLHKLLRFLVAAAEAGKSYEITESAIGIDVLGRRSFDPTSDAIVRKEMGRLRRKLAAFYQKEGQSRRWRIVIAKGSYLTQLQPNGTPPALAPRILLLPFEALNFEDEKGFCAGLTEDLMLALSAGGQLQLASRTTSFHFHGRRGDIRDFASQTGADWVMEATVRQEEGSTAVLAVRLADGRSGLSNWGAAAKADWDHPLAALDDLAAQICSRLGVQYPTHAGRQLGARYSRDPVARELLVRARQANHLRSREGVVQAFAYLQMAIDRDPAYAAAYAVKAQTHVVAGSWGAPPHQQMPLGRSAAEEALRLNPDLGEGHWALGAVQFLYDWDFSRAGETLERARQLDPLVGFADWWYEVYMAATGRVNEAADRMERLAARDPFSAALWAQSCSFSYNARRFDRAIEHGRRALELEPLFFRPHMMMAQTYAAMEEWDLAIEQARLGVAKSHGLAAPIGTLAFCLGLAGRHDEVKPLAAELEEKQKMGHVPAFALAGVPIGLGDMDGAFACCEKAIADRDPFIVWLDVWVWLDHLRKDSRFEDLRRKAGFVKP